MKTSAQRLFVLVALGSAVTAFPAMADHAVVPEDGNLALVRLAQLSPRDINESRGGDYNRSRAINESRGGDYNRTREINESRGGDVKRKPKKKKTAQ